MPIALPVPFKVTILSLAEDGEDVRERGGGGGGSEQMDSRVDSRAESEVLSRVGSEQEGITEEEEEEERDWGDLTNEPVEKKRRIRVRKNLNRMV
jgi:hypothetical protein